MMSWSCTPKIVQVVFLELCSSRTNVLLPSKREVDSHFFRGTCHPVSILCLLAGSAFSIHFKRISSFFDFEVNWLLVRANNLGSTVSTFPMNQVPSLSSMIESYKKKQMNLFGIIYGWFLAKV
jgi:hypothetical protein